MEFPKKEFVHVSKKNMIPEFLERYTEFCACYKIISDISGERWMCDFKKGFKLGKHKHLGRYEWIVISGKFRFKNPETKKECILRTGDYYCNPANVYHEEECLEDGKIIWLYDRKEDSCCHY